MRYDVSPWRTAKALVNEAIDQDPHRPLRDLMLFYPRRLPLARQTFTYAAGIIS